MGQCLSEVKYCSIQSSPHAGPCSLPMVPTKRNLTGPSTPQLCRVFMFYLSLAWRGWLLMNKQWSCQWSEPRWHSSNDFYQADIIQYLIQEWWSSFPKDYQDECLYSVLHVDKSKPTTYKLCDMSRGQIESSNKNNISFLHLGLFLMVTHAFWFSEINVITHLPLVLDICASESGQHWFK